MITSAPASGAPWGRLTPSVAPGKTDGSMPPAKRRLPPDSPAAVPRLARGRPIENMGLLRALAEAYGSQVDLAAALEISVRTLRNWGSGRVQPSAADKRAVNDLARQRGVPPPYPLSR